jgi:hypothetical protein
MFWDDPEDPDSELGLFTGILDNIEGDVVKIKSHIFVEDTIDGGATMWLRHPNKDGSAAKRYKIRTNGEEYPPDWPAPESLTGFEAKKEDTLPIRCKCNGVKFELHRGDYTGKKEDELPWFIDPRTHKNLVGFCACDSCRQWSGIDLFNFVFSEIKYVSFPSSDTSSPTQGFPTSTSELRSLVDKKDPRFGTLTYFASSEDVQRYFCSSCSASIFYAVDDRPDTIEMGVGCLDASDGARAEGFLSWRFGAIEQLGTKKDTDGGWREDFVQRVEDESERWREERGYPKHWKRE